MHLDTASSPCYCIYQLIVLRYNSVMFLEGIYYYALARKRNSSEVFTT